MSAVSTLSVRILNPRARNILDDLANVGLIEVTPYSSAIAEFQQEMSGVAEAHGIRDENDVAQIVADIHHPAVLVSADDWRSIQETLYLLSVPGMRESIRDGLQTPLEECVENVWSEGIQ